MKHVIVAVRDRAADTFGRPFFVSAVGQAIRSFSDEVNRADKDNPLWNHPEDFDLYELGSFDDDSGDLVSIKPRMVCVGKDARVKPSGSTVQ